MILTDATIWWPTGPQIERLKIRYPRLDIAKEMEAMAVMFELYPARRQTRGEIVAYVTKWLDITNESRDKSIPLREWTEIDDLTHDFTDSPELRAKWLSIYGQYMTHDGYRVVQAN